MPQKCRTHESYVGRHHPERNISGQKQAYSSKPCSRGDFVTGSIPMQGKEFVRAQASKIKMYSLFWALRHERLPFPVRHTPALAWIRKFWHNTLVEELTHALQFRFKKSVVELYVVAHCHSGRFDPFSTTRAYRLTTLVFDELSHRKLAWWARSVLSTNCSNH